MVLALRPDAAVALVARLDAALMQRFARLDADNDGTVTAAERKAARESMRQRRSQG